MGLSTNSSLINETLYQFIKRLLNGTDLYNHQVADLIEPEKYSVTSVHVVIWTFTILTYIIAIPLIIRMFHSRAYLNVIDYYSTQIILCAFIAWIPALILLLHHWFEIFTVRLCRFHYVILSANEAVPLFFVLYMTIERFLYAHPSLQHYCPRFSSMYFLHFSTIATWLSIILIYTLASPFYQNNSRVIYSTYTTKYCLYNYSKLYMLATARSILYFILFIPALIAIGFVLRYFYIMRGTNQIRPIEKLWTIRVTSLLCILIFYDIYLYYLEHIAETFKSFLLASLLRASFYLTQIFIIACTEPYWLELLLEQCACVCCLIIGRRRKTTTPIAITTETEFHTMPHSSSIGHYSLVDDNIDDEFDRALNEPQPTLRIIT
ncbi:unnamed protein product [Rotaria sordida]|nr:unnamed protein product [Rotaria sordida]CAF0764692.1 unnamed protein product [Rotaria sordida]CAF0768364.1 unnamed protein product [Rotaria sordida]CAF0800969.1 unnamed protein product [Rotaria sordida]CAF3678571.1 unnamed protein product [Rotaria sordida]